MSYLKRWETLRIATFSGQDEAEHEAAALLAGADARIAQLEATFMHIHKNKMDGSDSCAHCGLDLRDKIHARAALNGGGEA